MTSLYPYRAFSRPWTTRRVALNGAALRVVIIDDNRDVADALALYLSVQNIPCRPFYRGADAIIGACACPPHIVLMDISMPESDGFVTARKLRAALDSVDIVIVAHTAMDANEVQRRLTGDEFDGYLQKGRSPDEILGLLYRKQLAERFAAWHRFTELTQNPSPV